MSKQLPQNFLNTFWLWEVNNYSMKLSRCLSSKECWEIVQTDFKKSYENSKFANVFFLDRDRIWTCMFEMKNKWANPNTLLKKNICSVSRSNCLRPKAKIHCEFFHVYECHTICIWLSVNHCVFVFDS